MAEKYQARLYVLHVLHSPYKLYSEADNSAKSGEEAFISVEIIKKGTQKLREHYQLNMVGLNNNHEFHVVSGVPIVEIIRFARAQEVDLIVLGAVGSTALDRITFGSTAENVARRAHCSVMAVRHP
ncbi:MAG: universal stress protein [Deltaproteobacteria bacterium]|nr:universal stress protein [Deltaproteobacteria bacterium]